MRILIRFALIFIASFAFACEGDCYKCHPSLINSKNKEHAVIAKCVECHKDRIGKQPSNEPCGVDCFSCHPPQKIKTNIAEHKEISNCIFCHSVGGVPSLKLYDNPQPTYLRDRIKN
ncbi:MAG: hypothetical protein RL154_1315 [Pseudomonadota bacterium]|jgi:hypothetical protein